MAARYKVLIVDDEPDGLKVLHDYLAEDGYSVLTAKNGREAFDAAVESKPDLIVTDVSMPEMDGLALCRRLKGDRRTARVPVILISGVRKAEREQMQGFDLGADDYVTRPISFGLLASKMKALLRRAEAPEAPGESLKIEDVTLDLRARTAVRAGRPLRLTRKEFDLLTTLARKKDQVLSIPYLLETVWGYDPADYNDPNTVQVHVSSLRRKLGPKLGRRIVSVPGLGYRFS